MESPRAAAVSGVSVRPGLGILCGLALLVGLILWRQPWGAGSAGAVARSVTGGAALVSAGVCWIVARHGAYLGRRWQMGWGMVALALTSRAISDAIWLYFGVFQRTGVPSSLQPIMGYSLTLEPILFCAGLLTLTRAQFASERFRLMLDALALGGSATAVLWWLLLEPHLLASHSGEVVSFGWTRPFVATANSVVLVLALLSQRRDHLWGWSAFGMGAGLAFLAVADYRFFWLFAAHTGRPGSATIFDIALLALAPLAIGAAALWHLEQARGTQRKQTQERLARASAAQSVSLGDAGPAGRLAGRALDLSASKVSGGAVLNAEGIAGDYGTSGVEEVGDVLLTQTAQVAPATEQGFADNSWSNAMDPETGFSTGRITKRSIAGLQHTTTSGSALSHENASAGEHSKSKAQRSQRNGSKLAVINMSLLSASRPWWSLLMLAAPCIAALVGAWHISFFKHFGGTFITPSEIWWGPALVAMTAIRHAITFWQTSHFVQTLQGQTGALKDEVDLRTHQLSTLHAVAADLNNTLNREQVLSTALDRMMDAVRADAGAVWLRSDFDVLSEAGNFSGNGDPGSGRSLGGVAGNITNVAFLRREAERRETERREAERRRTGIAPNRTAPGRAGAIHWRLVRALGYERDAQRHALNVMNDALERGGLTHCALICSTQPEIFGSAHIAPIRWKGEVMGALGVMRWRGALEPAERALLDSIALEVGAALQNAHLYQEAKRRADLDGVTDLFNHRTVQEKLSDQLASARTSDKPLTIVMMDLNNFKFFNDTYGHPVGDGVLRTVAQCLRDTCRADDIIGRYGGDEFVALLPDTDASGALEVCSRIAARVEEEAYQGPDGRRIPIGLSFGAAVFPHDGTASLELLTIADANLYEAKRGGAPLMIQRPATEEAQELRQLKEVGVGGSFGVLDALVTAIDNKDHYTRRHSEDVTHWATLMARELGFSSETQRAVRICGLLHDVGKIAVPDSILRKPGRLNDEEFDIMQQHPVFGALIVKDVPNLAEVLGGIRHHHERFDGKGYPDKLCGMDIPLMGRLLAVPDCFSAMTTNRPYRKALSWAEAISEIERGKGTQFDPEMADAFLEVIAKIIADRNSTSFDKDGTRHSVLQLPPNIEEENGEAAAEAAHGANGATPLHSVDDDDAQEGAERVARPRSVTDADIINPAADDAETATVASRVA